MASPPNEYRTLRTINILLISGVGFSIVAKARSRKMEDRRQERRKKGKLQYMDSKIERGEIKKIW